MNRRDRPKVIANFAMTADGKVTTHRRTPASFTSPRDKHRLLEIRGLADALLVGRNTVATDTMSMTVPDKALRQKRRAQNRAPEPLRVIVSNRGNLDPTWKVFQAEGAPRIVFSTTRMPLARRRLLSPLCDLHLLSLPSVPISSVLAVLRRIYGVRVLLCEGGPSLLRSLLQEDTLDELYLTIAPTIFGGGQAPTLSGTNPDFFPAISHFRLVSLRTIGGECYLRYRRARS